MSWEEEWARSKQEASSGPELRLAGAGGSDGWADDSGGMRSDKKVWTDAGVGVGSLQSDIRKALADLERGQTGLGGGSVTGGRTHSGAAQLELYGSWKRYLEEVSGRCAVLQGRLEKAGNDHYKNDEAIEHAFDSSGDGYRDTATLGGHDGKR